MLENMCRPSIYDKCKSITGEKPLVRLKGTPYTPWAYEGFYLSGGMDRFVVYDYDVMRKASRGRPNVPLKLAIKLFGTCGDKLCDTYVKERFGEWSNAISSFERFSLLVDGFETYFKERKEQFMQKTTDIMAQMPKQLTKAGKIKTNSHGGVANLLKVLTNTMVAQGSSITSIAKMQYCVCTQAGIWLPEEFITDVLTAVDINGNIVRKEGN